MRGRPALLNSIAHSLVRLNPVQNISLQYFNIETEYQVTRANVTFEGGYQYATPRTGYGDNNDLRVFTLSIPVMRYYFGSQGQLLVDYERSTNFAWLEWMYNIHKLVKPFFFDHPVYGQLKVRFTEPLKVPKGLKGGQAALEGVELRLLEVRDTYVVPNKVLGPHFALNLDVNYWQEHNLFNFPHHLISTEYGSEDTVLSLGGNYQYTVRGSKPEQRVFTLYYEGLKYTPNYDLLDLAVEPELNAAYLENFYYWYRLELPFYYIHPTYGRIKVRFKEPLKIPKLRENGNGWTESFTITLVEVIEDAHRYL
jgi:hypothetical protein